MARSRQGISSRNLARLRQDLSYGSPVLYRKVPGQSRRYYDPKRQERDPVTQDYVFRVYKPYLSEHTFANTPNPRGVINRAVISHTKATYVEKKSLATTWAAKQGAQGNPVLTTNLALKEEEFKEAYQQFKIVSYEARHKTIDDPTRAASFAHGSPYDLLMVQLGRRTGEENFPIGESPRHAGATGSYINDVVLPKLRDDAAKTSIAQQQREAASERREAAIERRNLRREGLT